MRIRFIVAVAFFAIGRPIVAQDTVPDRYAAVIAELKPFIEREVAGKKLPALSIALVDDQKIVWSAGFGFRDPAAKVPTTDRTVYRVGSVSKLFTDLAVMKLVEQGMLDLDAPISRYVPGFQPGGPFMQNPTLRQAMSHRSGLVREPPVGNYFDPTNPTLAQTVESLNKTELVLAPGIKTKYSNAAIATVGYVLETTQKKPFAKYLRDNLLKPLGMTQSSFEPSDDVTKELAKAIMWTYHGREFPAPTFELGMAPAGSMYSTVLDLGQFLTVLFAGGKAAGGQIVKRQTIEQMWTPQFAAPGAKFGFGLGFLMSEFEGRRKFSHSGAMYGFATEFAGLPEDKLGVVVITSCDCANAVSEHIAEAALRLMLAARVGKVSPVPTTKQIDAVVARKAAGRYVTAAGTRGLDLIARDGKLHVMSFQGGALNELRDAGDGWMIDDRIERGGKMKFDGDTVQIGDRVFKRTPFPCPADPPASWLGLIGEYGWDHNTLFILEREGKLCALIEWFFLYPLTEVSESVYKFPDFGLYHDEKIVFTRDANGKATQAEAASVVFKRRRLDGEDGKTFQIQPERPVEELRKAALAATPPPSRGELTTPDLVELTTLDPSIKLDIRYATANNFLGAPVYTSAKAFLQRPAAEATVRVHRALEKEGYGLMIHDGYRPWFVTKIFWDATPPKHHIFVADPATGSRHNRGCAVDLTLFDRVTGKAVDMVGGYDEMSDRSYPDYWGGTSRQRWRRELLRQAMEAEGFTVYEAEWWHFDYKDWKSYPTLNDTFEKVVADREKQRKTRPD